MAGVRVLIAEPDEALRRAIAADLRQEGFDTGEFDSAADLPTMVAFQPALAILAITPNRCDGLAIARTLGATGETKLIFLSSLTEVNDRLAGFDLGAEDYLVKPIAVPELMARVRVILRRSVASAHEKITVGDVVIDLKAAVVKRGRHVVELTGTEFKLLTYLARHAGRVVAKSQLLNHVWASEMYDPNLVEVHMSALRRKIDAHGPRFIRTVRGVGYRLDPPIVEEFDDTIVAAPGGPREREFQQLAAGTHRLSNLVDDLLERDRANQLLTEREFSTVDLAKIADNLLASVPPDRSVKLNRLGLTIAPVLGDQGRLGVLLGNLVDNAVRLSPTGGEVTVTIEVAIHEILAKVQDQGPGIPHADRERIFDRFVRLDTARLSHGEGLGLGLAISRAIATEHGGTLTCDDTASGIGALFTLRLPAPQISIPV
jgi:two-component system, OmpR family, response regulator